MSTAKFIITAVPFLQRARISIKTHNVFKLRIIDKVFKKQQTQVKIHFITFLCRSLASSAETFLSIWRPSLSRLGRILSLEISTS